MLRTNKKQALKNTYKNQWLMILFNGCEIFRVIEAELHNVTGSALGQLCIFRSCYFAPETSKTPLSLELLAFGGKN